MAKCGNQEMTARAFFPQVSSKINLMLTQVENHQRNVFNVSSQLKRTGLGAVNLKATINNF